MQIIGKLVSEIGLGTKDYQAIIELPPRELLEQLTHKQIGELLEMINLPEPKKDIEELKGDWVTDEQKLNKIENKINEIINFLNRKEIKDK